MGRSKLKEVALEVPGTSKHLDVPGTSKHLDVPGTSKRRVVPVSSESLPFLKTRMSPSAILQFINSGLSDMQVSDIRDMGFGGILCLKTDTIPGQLAYWLVSEFDPFTSSLLNNQLPVRDEDVHIAVGLPMGEIPISQASKYDHSDEFLSLVNAWKSQYGGIDKVKYSHILHRMSEQKEGGEHFKRNFIVFIVSTFLMGVKGAVPSLRILKCLGDVSLITRLKWCDFTRKNIISSVQQWRNEKERADKGGCPKTFKGPIMVLIFIYLDRMVFKARTVDRVFPTLCTWTKEAISVRVSKEKREARRFGAGFVDGRLVKQPGCFGIGFVEHHTTVEPDDVGDQETVEVDNHGATDNPESGGPANKRSRVSCCIEKMANAAKVLAQSYESFLEAVNDAKILLPNSVVVGQLSAMADSLLGGFQLTPPRKQEVGGDLTEDRDKGHSKADRNEVSDDAVAAARVSNTSDTAYGAHGTSAPVDPEGQSARVTLTTGGPDDDPCWNDASFVAAVCALANAFNKEPEPASVPATKKRRAPPEYPTFNLFASQDKSGSQSQSGANVASPLSAPGHHFPPSPQPPDHSEAKPQHKRDIIISDVFKSPYVQRNISMLSELSQSERDVSDLVFSAGLDDSEVLFSNRYFQLRRCDLKSLIVDMKIAPNVINAWAHVLNKKEEIKAPSSPLRLYAVVTHNGIRCEDSTDYAKVKLMFFPFMSREPFLICVNFMTRKVEVIHPMRPRTVDFTESVRMVREFILHVMTTKASKFAAVQFFRYEELVPTANMINDVDDGIYLMCYMETYTGCRQHLRSQVVNTKTGAALVKILFRQKLKYCSAILSCDQNELSKQVLSDARRLVIKNGKQVQAVRYSDAYLLDYVFRPSEGDEAKYDVVVQTDFMQVTKEGMSCMRSSRQWVVDMVIDMFGIYSTVRSPDLLYIPTIARKLNPKRDTTLGRNYINMSYMPPDGTFVKAMFIPIIEEDHWFLCVCDLESKKNYILNSIRPKDPQAEIEIVAGVVDNVVQILGRYNGYKHFVGVPLARFEHVPVPQQPNLHDCGVYVLKWLEAGRDRSLWETKNNFKALGVYRKRVAVTLLRWQENLRKHF